MSAIEVVGQIGPDGPRLLVLYTGGTIGMGPGPDGALVPLDLRELGAHLPFIQRLPIALTVATFVDPIDSSDIHPSDWLDLADAIVQHAPGHAGVVLLHGTDTMAYTASALSFLLEGIDIPIVVTGAQRPVTELRSDGRENLVTALAIAAGHLRGAALVPEVTIFFDDVLLRGN
ncbi:MAG: asparaginase domain-containing protein, partial [Ilumatobacteraceae bacterium]